MGHSLSLMHAYNHGIFAYGNRWITLLHMQQALCPVVNAERFAEDLALSLILKEVLGLETIPLPPSIPAPTTTTTAATTS